MNGYLLGFDVGSSSIRPRFLTRQGDGGGYRDCPKLELAIDAKRPGWAEQDPAVWWENVVAAAAELKAAAGRHSTPWSASASPTRCTGLCSSTRPAWFCDRPSSGATAGPWLSGEGVPRHRRRGVPVATSEFPPAIHRLQARLGKRERAGRLRPGQQDDAPGDWIALRMTGEIRTTPSGLSEGILWDFSRGGRARHRCSTGSGFHTTWFPTHRPPSRCRDPDGRGGSRS